ncbi:hypothetical protein DMH15_14685 [Streptomyces sp. WAC 06725]|nr:hypothetical protein DMH15_14685 [Streptomyces sp. WAC 06725]
MTMPTPRPSAALTCRSDQVGRCARCQQPCHRYGYGGNPLCVRCLAPVRATHGKPMPPAAA